MANIKQVVGRHVNLLILLRCFVNDVGGEVGWNSLCTIADTLVVNTLVILTSLISFFFTRSHAPGSKGGICFYEIDISHINVVSGKMKWITILYQ